jgi:hypothetical protein
MSPDPGTMLGRSELGAGAQVSRAPPERGAAPGHPDELDEVDRGSWASFPASDPPAWMGSASSISTAAPVEGDAPGPASVLPRPEHLNAPVRAGPRGTA